MLHTLVALALQVAPPAQAPRADSARPATRDSAAVADSTKRRREKRAPRRLALTPELERSAFLDTAARRILLRARAARLQQDSLLRSYDAKAYQRFSIGMAFRALARERLALREETSGRVRWVRGNGMHVELTGARAVIPIAGKGGHFHATDMTPIPYFPGREPLFPVSAFSTMRAEVDDNNLIHPLATGAEAYYHYRAGNTMTIVLPNRERITLRELEITARRPDWNAVVGSFWFDDRSGQLVRAAYRLAAPLDIWRIAEEENDDDDDVPAAVKAMFSPARFDVTAITTEYELIEGRFWMPRANFAEGTLQLGFVRTPFKMQEKYSYLSVNGMDSLPTAMRLAAADSARDGDGSEEDGAHDGAHADSTRRRDESSEAEVSINIGGGQPDTAAIRRRLESDTTPAGRRRLERRLARARECASTGSYVQTTSRFDGALRYRVSVPCDSAKLATSADLPPSIYEDGEEAFDEAQRDELLKSIDFGLQPGMGSVPVKPYWGLNLVRYNRVEGLSSAVGARWTPGGGWTADGQLRLGLADFEPNAELNLSRSNARTTLGVGAYRRLVAANDRGDPLGFGASLATLLYGRDEGFYYRTAGLELTGRRGTRGQIGWRVFAEDHSTAEKETDWSLAKTFAGNDLLPNITAREGVATGAAATYVFTRGLDPRGWRLAGDWRVEGAIGDFDYARSALDATLSRGLGRRVEGALTGAAGYSGGGLPPQRAWYLGGAQTVRGQLANTQNGDAFWMGRAELARSWPVMRPVVFGDVGWAGARERLFDQPGRVMSGAGVGASFLDGLMRVDLSRGIRPRQMWRLDMYLEARF